MDKSWSDKACTSSGTLEECCGIEVKVAICTEEGRLGLSDFEFVLPNDVVRSAFGVEVPLSDFSPSGDLGVEKSSGRKDDLEQYM